MTKAASLRWLAGDTRGRKRLWSVIPVCALILGVALTALAANAVWLQDRERARMGFEREAALVQRAVADRVTLYERMLRAGRGMVATHDELTAEQWERFIRSLDLAAAYPGIGGLGFVAHVPPEERERLDGAERRRSLGSPVGRRDSQDVVVHAAGGLGDAVVIGQDAAADPVRRAAIEAARDSGQPVLSWQVARDVMIFYLAVYRGGGVPARLEDRRVDIVGWLAAPIDLKGFLGEIAAGHPSVSIDVVDRTDEPAGKSADPHPARSEPSAFVPAFTVAPRILIGGRVWSLTINSTPSYESDAAVTRDARLVVAIGFLVTLVLSWTFLLLIHRHEHAFALARSMTSSLRESEARYRGLVESQGDMVVRLDASGRAFTFVNDTVCAVFGRSRESLIGAGWSDLVDPDDRSAVAATLRHLRSSGKSRVGADFRILTAHGPRWYSWEGYALRDERGAVTEFQGVGRDITARLECETALMHAQKLEALGCLAGGLAHELQNALMPVMMLAETTLRDMPEAGPAADKLRLILASGVRMSDLISRVLVYSRRPDPSVRRAALDLGAAVRNGLALVGPMVPASIELTGSVDESLGTIVANPGHVETILLNLASNAIHAMKGAPGGVLEVTLSRVSDDPEAGERPATLKPGPHARLTVSDTGHGMDEATVNRVFEPFFTTKVVGEGTGIGLATIKGILSEIGGAVTVSSAPGVGTRFDVYLPLDPGSRGLPAPPAA